jgi:hypothetical protein
VRLDTGIGRLATLQTAVDLDTVRSELLAAVDGAVQPAHASVWIRPAAPCSPV